MAQHTKNSPKRALSDKDFEKIGRSMESIVLFGYANKKRLFYTNFLRGTFFGLGSAFGATIMIALLLFVLSLFGELPFIGNFFDSAKEAIKEVPAGR